MITAAVRTVFGCEPEQLNGLFALTYAQAGGGLMRLTMTDPGCAQEKKIKVKNYFKKTGLFYMIYLGWITTNIKITCRSNWSRKRST